MRSGQVARGWRLAGISAAVVLVLAGCESTRFGSRGGAVVAARAQPDPLGEPVASSVPSGSVTTEPLGPPPGSGPSPVASLPSSPEPFGAAPASPPPGPTSRSAAVGGWTAKDASGASCRVNLTGNPSLDLYRASAGGCANKDLARVTAWDFRDGEVYLYQPGGAVAARLRSSGSGLSGVLAKSGAPLTLSRS